MITVEKKETKQQTEPEPEKEQPDIEALINELPEKFRPVMRTLVTGIFQNMVQTNDRLQALENKPAYQDPKGAFDGLSPEQRYNILLTRAQAPAAQAQMALYQGLLSGLKGNSGGGLDQLAGSAKSIEALRSILIPAPTPLQMAMEKVQISQMMAQTRLMNKVAGKETSSYLDRLEKELEE